MGRVRTRRRSGVRRSWSVGGSVKAERTKARTMKSNSEVIQRMDSAHHCRGVRASCRSARAVGRKGRRGACVRTRQCQPQATAISTASNGNFNRKQRQFQPQAMILKPVAFCPRRAVSRQPNQRSRSGSGAYQDLAPKQTVHCKSVQSLAQAWFCTTGRKPVHDTALLAQVVLTRWWFVVFGFGLSQCIYHGPGPGLYYY